MPRIIAIVLALLIVALAAGIFLFNKSHVEVADQAPDFTMSATDLFTAFETNETEANTTYLDKLIEVTGTVGEKSTNSDGSVNLILRDADAFSGVSCAFLPEDSEAAANIESGQTITVRGVCTGMLMDVSLARCVIVK